MKLHSETARNKERTNDQGAISILVLTGVMGLLSFLFFAGFVIQNLFTAHHLNNAADLVALGSAKTLVSSPDQACVVASDLSQANEVVLTECEVSDDVVQIQVSTNSTSANWLANWTTIGRARAGIEYLYK